MNLKDFKPNDRVIYIPYHAYSDRTHPDCRWGTVSTTNGLYVFVKFDAQVKHLGWDGTTSQACNPEDLEK
jgi:hypothetical protein